jgi:aspartyl-tRNA(Asn)/glutamyl-tRNA(Gln) amidotransferase subunit B
MEYTTVIGLEVHAQLKTDSKLFCACSTRFGDLPNRNTCPVCTGMPGALPVVNRRAVDFALRLGTGLGCEVRLESTFARKNYFYPDLPRGYQISQFDLPIAERGSILVPLPGGEEKRVGITRIHLEDDAGKNLHLEGFNESLVDYNRCGVPLIEIVSEPDMRSSDEAIAYLKELRSIVRFLGICDGNMEEGSFRCDANVSVMPEGASKFGTRSELKNLNSFRSIQRGIEYEVRRHISVLEQGGTIVQETRLFDDRTGETHSMRSKEEAHDYRYFPEPDLPPLRVASEWLETVRASMPRLPAAYRQLLGGLYGLPQYDTEVLTAERDLAEYALAALEGSSDPKSVSNWLMTEVMAVLNDRKWYIGQFPVPPKDIARLMDLRNSEVFTQTMTKNAFARMWQEGCPLEEISGEMGAQISDAASLESVCERIIEDSPEEWAKYLSGKDAMLKWFVGQAMRQTRGKANPQLLSEVFSGISARRRRA